MNTLADQFCPNVHDAPITAACYDPVSGVTATADATGVLAIQRQGERAPGLVFQPGGPISGALGLVRGGSLVAMGDDEGTVGVYRTSSGDPVFEEIREGARGRTRAMQGIAIAPEGTLCASIAADGLVRMWDLSRGEREVSWSGFSGSTVEFDARGERLLCMDEKGQPRLVDLLSRSGLPMEPLQMPARWACFTVDGTHVLAVGSSGISLLKVADGQLIRTFASRGGSGLLNIVVSPDGGHAAVVSRRSVHTFTLPDLQPADHLHHGAPEPSGACLWTPGGIRVAGSDGLLHDGKGAAGGSLGQVTAIASYGDHLVVAHGSRLAYWHRGRRVRVWKARGRVRKLAVDRSGRLVVAVPEDRPMEVHDVRNGRFLFDGGTASVAPRSVDVGGAIVAVHLAQGGIRWWNLEQNQTYDLPWPEAMTLSGSGTWMGVVTPRGAVRILDPDSGREALEAPVPLAEVPVRHLAFINRKAEMLVIDDDGVLGHYDLREGILENRPAEGRDLLDFEVEVDALWGATGGRFAAIRLPEEDGCSLVTVSLQEGEVLSHLTDLHPQARLDEETGRILQPARSGGVLEMSHDGEELRVLRSLPEDQWVSFGFNGILEASESAGDAMVR